MTCTASCMVGGGQQGGDKIVNNIKKLEPYSNKQLEKLFKKNNFEYDYENGREENITLFSMKVEDSEEKVQQWIKKNKGLREKHKKKLTRNDLLETAKQRQGKLGCNTNLQSNKQQLKNVADKFSIEYPAKATVKQLRSVIKEYKKVKCMGLSKMKKADLVNFITENQIPMRLKFSKKTPEIKTFIISTPEAKGKEKANKIYEANKEIYNAMDWDELAVDGYSVVEATSLEDAHKKAMKLHKSLTRRKPTPTKPKKKSAIKQKSKRKATPKKIKEEINFDDDDDEDPLQDEYNELYNEIELLTDKYFGSNKQKAIAIIKKVFKIKTLNNEEISTISYAVELMLRKLSKAYRKPNMEKMKEVIAKLRPLIKE